MKKSNIKHLGLRFSAYSERGAQIKRWKRTYKKETTVKAISFLAALSITPLTVQMYV